MRLQQLDVDKKPKIMIIPMIDIIFFLLVFFMMSMLTMVVQKSISLNLPQTVTSKLDIPVAVTSDGQIYVEQEKIPRETFRRRMEIEKNRNPNLSIVLRADTKSEHGDFVFVLDQLKSVGISKIGIATEAKSQSKE